MLNVPVKVFADSADFYFKIAIQKYKKEDFNGALLDINKAIRINPNVSDFYGIRASIYGRMLNYESSCEDMRKAISMGDKIVPGYYHRRNFRGDYEASTCCNNTASEHYMFDRLIVDDLVHWAKDYKVDGFRFDLMGHIMLKTMLKAKAKLEPQTP